MSGNDERLRDLITQQAADWFTANRAGLSERERQAFVVWLRESPVHIEEYLALSVIARDLHAACEDSRDSLEELLARARLEAQPAPESLWTRFVGGIRHFASPPAWQATAPTLAAVAVVSVGLALLWHLSPAPHHPLAKVTVSQFETRHGEQQTQRLADGSVLHLNTDTAVTVHFSRNERVVELTAGEVDFEVTHQSERPFRVLAGPAEVVDLGTRFDVRLDDDSTLVTVVEGRVDVGLLPPSTDRGAHAAGDYARHSTVPGVQLRANQQITVSASAWPAQPVAVDSTRSTAWMHRQISFDHEPLERVAHEFNRYSRKPIEITSPALRKLEISGVFSTDDIDAFVAFLRSLDGVRVEVTETRIRVSQN